MDTFDSPLLVVELETIVVIVSSSRIRKDSSNVLVSGRALDYLGPIEQVDCNPVENAKIETFLFYKRQL